MTLRRHARGFTLLELLLATTMLAALGAALFAAMHIGFRAREQTQRQLMLPRQAAIALDLIEGQLQSLMPPTGVLAGAFVGYDAGSEGQEADWLDGYALGADDRNDDTTDPLAEGIRRVQLRRVDDTLAFDVQRNLLATTQTDAQREVLARGVTALAIRYYDGYGWKTEWDSTQVDNVLPLAIEVTIELQSRQKDRSTYRQTRIVPLSAGRISTDSSLFGGL